VPYEEVEEERKKNSYVICAKMWTNMKKRLGFDAGLRNRKGTNYRFRFEEMGE